MTRALPPLLEARAEDGLLRLRWPPLPAAASRAALVVALRPLTPDLAGAFWAGDLDHDLIRYPVTPSDRGATLHVPAGRTLHVALIARDRGGDVLPCPAPRTAPTPAEDAPGGARSAPLLEGPVAHDHAEAGQDVPLVFAHGEAAPDLEAMARRVAEQVAGRASGAPEERAPGGFGSRQRWTLTRLAWDDAGPGPLVAVVRPRFIDAEDLAAWRDATPEGARPLPDDADGLVDGLTPEGEVAFYAVLRGPAPWRPVPLAPCPPPFDRSRRPALLGDVAARLEAGVDAALARLEAEPLALSDLPTRLALLEAAVEVLPVDAPIRRRVEAAARQWREGPAFG